MATTWNYNSDTYGPVHNWIMGPIADRPAEAELHTVFVSTDEGNGELIAYLYDGTTPWMRMNGIEGFTDSGGGALPAVTSADNGKVLGVSSGEWEAVAAPEELPAVTAADNGKVLGVDNGEWAAVSGGGGGGSDFVIIECAAPLNGRLEAFECDYVDPDDITAALTAGKIPVIKLVGTTQYYAGTVTAYFYFAWESMVITQLTEDPPTYSMEVGGWIFFNANGAPAEVATDGTANGLGFAIQY